MVKVEGNNNAFFRQLLFLAVLIVIGLVITKQLVFFIGSFLGAITMYVVVRRPFFRMTEKHRWRPWIASLILVSAMTCVILVLGYLVFEVIANQVVNLDTSQLINRVKTVPDELNKMLGVKVITDETIGQSTSYLTKVFSGIINTTYSFALNVFMMLILLYFMLAHARKMEKVIFTYMPFSGKSLALIKEETQSMIYSNAVGIPLVMFSQAVAAALVYWLLGLNNVVFWAFVTALCGLVPMIGTLIVSLPLGIYMISGGDVWQGIVLIFCGLFVIANVDNLARIVLMQKVANTHPLIVIFGVILGIPLFGFWGIIFGPLLISGFLLLIKIYYMEYRLITPAQVRMVEREEMTYDEPLDEENKEVKKMKEEKKTLRERLDKLRQKK